MPVSIPVNQDDAYNFITFGAVNRIRYRDNGVTAWRNIVPHFLYYGRDGDMKEDEWLIQGYDTDNRCLMVMRIFNIQPR